MEGWPFACQRVRDSRAACRVRAEDCALGAGTHNHERAPMPDGIRWVGLDVHASVERPPRSRRLCRHGPRADRMPWLLRSATPVRNQPTSSCPCEQKYVQYQGLRGTGATGLEPATSGVTVRRSTAGHALQIAISNHVWSPPGHRFYFRVRRRVEAGQRAAPQTVNYPA